MTWIRNFGSQHLTVEFDFDDTGDTVIAPDGDIEIVWEFNGGVRITGDGSFVGSAYLINKQGKVDELSQSQMDAILAVDGQTTFQLAPGQINKWAGFGIGFPGG